VAFKTISAGINLVVVTVLLTSPIYAQNNKTTSRTFNDSISKQRVFEEKFISINGIEQWVTIKGERSKPVILFLHGGPGSVMSAYSDNLYKEWEKDFIIVQWDQRGAGRTFGRSAPAELTPGYLKANPLTLEQMLSDGIELSEYLVKHLGKRKIILFGSSWGSVLGVKMATKRADLYYAYVGHAQVVNPSDDLPLYNKVYQMAQENKDDKSIEVLNTIGKPPFERAKTVGQVLRIVKKYEAERSIPAPNSWFVPTANYNNERDNQNRSDGDDYSFVNYVGDNQLGVRSMRSTIDLLKDNVNFKIPVYLVQGEEDLLTPKESTKNYFEKINAPEKKYFLLPKTAHEFNVPVLEAQYKIFKSIKTS
jgi:pimeloyl-ACP methyl ester carboxylesterase